MAVNYYLLTTLARLRFAKFPLFLHLFVTFVQYLTFSLYICAV